MKKFFLFFYLIFYSAIGVSQSNDQNFASCETQKYLATGNYLEDNFKQYVLAVGACKIKSTWDGSYYFSEVSSNGLVIFKKITSDKGQSMANEQDAISTLRKALRNCGCTKL